MVKITTIIKFLFLAISCSILLSCSQPSNYKSEIIQSIPDTWSVDVEQVERYTGNWWESFGDTTFVRFFSDFQSASPDLKSIINQSTMAKNSAKIRIRNRCEISGRPHGVYRKLKISRIALRDMASSGKIPGITKSSW